MKKINYMVIPWPEVQEYMDEEWFSKEAQLIDNPALEELYGNSAYLVPCFRVIKHTF